MAFAGCSPLATPVLFLTRLTVKLNLPDVTCYLVAGLLVGPLCLGRLNVPGLGFVSFEFVEEMGLISDVALGFIAFSIGNEFRISALKKIGRQATIIAVFQAIAAAVLVDLALLGLHLLMPDLLPVSSCLILVQTHCACYSCIRGKSFLAGSEN